MLSRRGEAATAADLAGRRAGRDVGLQVDHTALLYYRVTLQPEGL
jgi:hypothetical protein